MSQNQGTEITSFTGILVEEVFFLRTSMCTAAPISVPCPYPGRSCGAFYSNSQSLGEKKKKAQWMDLMKT